ncbi:MAG: hypothetical protein MJ177_10330, partial [Clostridia bacterium]|nr:hypothetical protein [Clostridia bacterium]
MKKLHLICNAHIDPVWQWTWDEGISAAISTFRTAADLCDEFDYIFCHNEALLYEAIEKCAPALFERIKKLVLDGKWKIIGGWYLQPDCNLPCGESFVRQIKAGRKFFSEKFGVEPSVACNFDSFGHSVGIVQIMKKCGYDGYIIHRPWDSVFDYPGRFFKWKAPDGSSVTVCRVDSYGSGLGHAAEKIISHAKNAEDTDAVLWGVGNHGGGPSRKDLFDIEKLRINGTEIFHSYPEKLFSDNIKISGEIKTSLVPAMPGCYTSMMKIKQANRQTENLIYETEKMISAASLGGFEPDYKALEEAEKKLLLAQFHDILPGSSVQDGEREGLELLASARKTFREERTRALMHLTMEEKAADTGEYPIFVFNPNPYELTCPVEAEFSLADQNWDENTVTAMRVYQNGEEIPVQQIKDNSTINLDWRKRIMFSSRLAPMSFTRFSVFTHTVSVQKKERNDFSLEKLLSSKALAAPVCLRMYEDTADPWAMSEDEHTVSLGKNPVDFKPMDAVSAAEYFKTEELSSRHIIEDGEIYTAIEEFTECKNTKAVTEYKIYKDYDYVDLKITVEFADKNCLVRLRLPVQPGRLCGDGPYVTEYKIGKEVCYQKWLGTESNGTVHAVINDGVYGGIYTGDALELTLLRGAGYLFHPIGERELYNKDRYLPRIDSGRYIWNFRIYKGSVKDVTLAAQEFSSKPYGINIFPIGTGKEKTGIYTDKKVVMPVCRKSGNG